MEEAIKRTVGQRNSASYRRRTKRIRVYNLKAYRKILLQLSISGLILIFIVISKGIDKPLTKGIIQNINNLMASSIDWAETYKTLGNWGQSSLDFTKALFEKRLETPKSQVPVVKASAENSEKVNEGVSSENQKSAISQTAIKKSIPNKKAITPVFSSTNSLELDIKAISSEYKFAVPAAGVLSSPFGLRINPITHKEEFHPGIDIAANTGTSIKCALSGVVIEARRGETYGNFIRVQTGKDITTLYAHCSKLLVKKDQKVSKGQVIAKVGNTGMSKGSHLHFEIFRNQRAVDPKYFISLRK